MLTVDLILKAENVAKKYSVSREEQDLFALNSQQKCEAAQNAGYFNEEIVPVSITTRQGTSKVHRIMNLNENF